MGANKNRKNCISIAFDCLTSSALQERFPGIHHTGHMRVAVDMCCSYVQLPDPATDHRCLWNSGALELCSLTILMLQHIVLKPHPIRGALQL